MEKIGNLILRSITYTTGILKGKTDIWISNLLDGTIAHFPSKDIENIIENTSKEKLENALLVYYKNNFIIT